jgi:hypothetical protein
VSSLNYIEVLFGEPVIQKDDKPIGILFIKDNGVTVYGIHETIRLLDLHESSFIGEWEVIFD